MTKQLTAYDQLQQTDSHEALVRLSRKFLSQNRVEAWVDVFTEYQRRCPDRRWGLENPLESILGPLRIKAIYILQRPEYQAHHDIAAFILYEASKPKDIPLALGLLAKQPLEHSELVECLSWLLQAHCEHITPEQQQQFLQIARRFDGVEPRRVACQYAVIFLRLSSPELIQWAHDYFERIPLTTSFHYYWERACHIHEPMIELLTRKIATSSFDRPHDHTRFDHLITQAAEHHDAIHRRMDNWLALLNSFEDSLGRMSLDTTWWQQQIEAFDELFEDLYVEEGAPHYNLQQTTARLFACLPKCFKQPDALFVWFLLVKQLELTTLPQPLRVAAWSCLSAHHEQALRLIALDTLDTLELPWGHYLDVDDIKRVFCAIRFDDDLEVIEKGIDVLVRGSASLSSLWPVYFDMLQHPNVEVRRCVAVCLDEYYNKHMQPTAEHRWTLQYIHDQSDDPETLTALRSVLRAMNQHLEHELHF